MRSFLFKSTLFAIALMHSPSLQADNLPVLTSGHADIGVNFEDGVWDLHVHAEEIGKEYEPGSVWLKCPDKSMIQVSTNANFAFLGNPGTPIWVLPATENHDLLFLGLGTEEMDLGLFKDNTVQLALKSVNGPGHLIVYHLDPLGTPVVSMNSRDGVDDRDVSTLKAGGHSHVNWVFTAPGKYRISFQASGALEETGKISVSDVTEYLFDVAPFSVEYGHVGVSVAYSTNSNSWTLASGNAALGIKFIPDYVRWVVKSTALQSIPNNPRYAFMGEPGNPVWLLPETQNPSLLWPGFGLQSAPSGIFLNDDISIRLTHVEGPGYFFLYHSDPTGNPVVSFNTRNGINVDDIKVLKAGSHVHPAWGFTEPGSYRITLQASGQFSDGDWSHSVEQDYFFEVEYEPVISVAQKNPGMLILRFLSRKNQEYVVQVNSDLAQDVWQAAVGVKPVEGTGTVLDVDVPLTDKAIFFRLEMHPMNNPH